ncbi:hypothetical protein [Fluviicola taffensis]|uniref:Lipoprotein n=1 Tax=Fluviicola taffensis (strain DSM 16823 / NCIMB 13979 / RW262) TaxID=755732 RepID=F2IIQ2_FLUTR|nr:hypothetical protein [Fluviicola taffensis]AEA46014.1 hypothetical protein Fluta_4052 [Fluviicola taffensis DSM 16823]
MKLFKFSLLLVAILAISACSKDKKKTPASTNPGTTNLPSTFTYTYASGSFHFVSQSDGIDVTLNAAPQSGSQIGKDAGQFPHNLISLISEDLANPTLTGNPDLIFVLTNQNAAFYATNQSIHIGDGFGDDFQFATVVNSVAGKFRPLNANVVFTKLSEQQIIGSITGTFDFDNDDNSRNCTVNFTLNK